MSDIKYTEDIDRAVSVMKRGGVILYPTDTVWGIGCDASNAEAVKRVYEIKHRADSKALITLVADIDMLYRTVNGIPEVAEQLIEASDRPVTIVYDKGIGVAHNLLAEDGTLGVRVTSEPFSQSLCRRMHRPIVSTSANISGAPTPRCFKEISSDIIDAVDYVCLSNRSSASPGKPSLIIRITESGEFKILRK